MEGARAVFLAQGFDGASMGEIARRAGVSKGTLYVADSGPSRTVIPAHRGQHSGDRGQFLMSV
jgi:hypothetical protein